MIRYEYRDDKSAKFWEGRVDGETLTVRFGRIGTNGQTKDKTFASAAAAQKEFDKLTKEKTSKGYVTAGESDAPICDDREETVKPESSPLPEAPASAAAAEQPILLETARIVTAAPLPSRSRPAPAPEPVDWKAHWADLATRLLKAETVAREVLDRLSSLPAFQNNIHIGALHGQVHTAQKHCDALSALRESASARTAPPPFSIEAMVEWMECVENAFRDCFFYAMSEDKRWTDYVAAHRALAAWTVQSQGATAALTVAALAQKRGLNRHFRTVSACAFREALSRAPETDYDAALAFALESRDGNIYRDGLFAFVLADDRPGEHALKPLAVLHEAASLSFDTRLHPEFAHLVLDAPPSQTEPCRIQRGLFQSFHGSDVTAACMAATAQAVARAHGESPTSVLEWLSRVLEENQRCDIACAILDDEAFESADGLYSRLMEKPIRAAFDLAQKTYPRRMFARLLIAYSTGRVDPAIRGRLFLLLNEIGQDVAQAIAQSLDAKAQKSLGALLDLAGESAPREAWPTVLSAPPWRAKRAKSEDIRLTLEPISTPTVIGAMAAPAPDPYRRYGALSDLKELPKQIAFAETQAPIREPWPAAEPMPAEGADAVQWVSWLGARCDALAGSESWLWGTYANMCRAVARQPEELAMLLWSRPRFMAICSVEWRLVVPEMMSRFGDKALEGLLGHLRSNPVEILPIVAAIGAPEIAPIAARAMLRLKKARDAGRDWLRAHPRTAIYNLLPQAIGAPGQAREEAEYALRWMAAAKEANAALLQEATRDYAQIEPRVEEAVKQVLTRDPLRQTPAKVAKLPAWLAPAALVSPKLRSGGALPQEAVVALLEMLSFVKSDDVYPGVAQVREACDPKSLSAFAFDLFSAWLGAGAPGKDGWAMRAMGWIGDDECARKLTPLLRKWPGESAHARAVSALDVLADIGSDVALMHLNGVAEKVKFKGLQDKAREKIAAIAEARDLTPEELADRLAPDLDLDSRGGLDLDFGERKFRVGFDEFLKPWVKDSSGARIKDLPKPNKSDDAEKAAAAQARWSTLKKDARAAAALQITRLETMLGSARRVSPEVFWTFFAAHPFIRHLAQRLVWAAYDEDGAATFFRVADDLSFTDANDDPIEIDVTAQAKGKIGLAHPIYMSDDERIGWGALFGDYEIVQPFPQLGREIFALTESEKSASEIGRFDGVEIESPRLWGMRGRGWRLGQPQDAGGIHWIERHMSLPGGEKLVAYLPFEDGIYAGAPDAGNATQKLGKIMLGEPNWYGVRRGAQAPGARTFGALDPLVASEILRDVATIAQSAGKAPA
ncbi:WGR and DUF4132 domain-containing protein [Methylocystis heyeri]|uniref:DUF4132 domain-containing protein n=1 Tax=Methylocystis heyeri TaxID=391905 RepID=A0A6B8KHC8_9HYPH|nr:WGR and DUF4132 domain-containing protein [Methylocystis heyeri]QGM46401.1 DUF4132 domain-containing protein [Methylocystis heyeri]